MVAWTEDDAVPAAPAAAVESAEAPAGDDGAPVGPSEGEEAAYLAEQRESGFAPAAPAREAATGTAAEPDPEAETPLPPLDDLVGRIPPATRQLMEELFRARFITVKRVPKSALK